MVLDFGSVSGMFPHNKSFGEGVAERGNRAGGATIVVSVDGTGDAEAIQEGINMLPSTGGVVYIKEGTYVVSAQIDITTNNVSLIGAGRSTVLSTTANISILKITSADYCTIERIRFTGNSTGASQRGLNLSSCDHTSVLECWFDNLNANGLYIQGTANHDIVKGNIIDTCGGAGLYLSGTNCVISNNIIKSSGTDGITIAGGDENIICNNQILNNTSDGIETSSTANQNVIVGNYIDGNGAYGIVVTSADRTLISSNIIYNNTSGAVNDSGTNTHPNGSSGTTNLAMDDLNIIA